MTDKRIRQLVELWEMVEYSGNEEEILFFSFRCIPELMAGIIHLKSKLADREISVAWDVNKNLRTWIDRTSNGTVLNG